MVEAVQRRDTGEQGWWWVLRLGYTGDGGGLGFAHQHGRKEERREGWREGQREGQKEGGGGREVGREGKKRQEAEAGSEFS